MKKILIVFGMTLFPLVLFAQDPGKYQCSLDELTRRIEILHEPGVTVPCEVHYIKDTEMPGEVQVLWRASTEEGYCEAKAAELVQKLEGMGWTCWVPSSGAGEEAEVDDTDALTPAEDIEIPETDTPEIN